MNHHTLAISQGLRIFATLQNFARLQIFATCDTIHATFAFLTFCHFLIVFSICPHCNGVCFVILVICNGGLAIKAPRQDIVSSFSFSFSFSFYETFFGSLIKFGEKLSAASALFHFLSFSLTFSLAK